MEKTITLTVNGAPRTVTTDADRPLLEYLREDLRLTGTKRGCGEGKCGACTVPIGGRPTVSCLTPISKLEGERVETIESLARGDTLHPVQEAFLEEAAMQCGFCTPGFVMAVAGMLRETPRPSATQLQERLEGHLCRCCGYPRIVAAIQRAAARQL